MDKAVFLDRDGVINRRPPEGEYITRWEDLQVLPGVADAVGRLRQAGFRIFVVTNQRCVSKGLITAGELEAMHRRMCEQLAAVGGIVDSVYYCPHEKVTACKCRKPAPGMLLTAAREHQIDLAASWMIGDSEIDVEAGRNAGCRTVRLLEGVATSGGEEDVMAASLPEAIDQILQMDADKD
jgi:D-glycero-D-manno-heptose 1,7-bisphosphate phosphatase